MPILAAMPFCAEVVVFGGFSFAPPDLFSQDCPLPVVVVVLKEPCFTHHGSNSPGMPISRPCLPVKDNGSQDPKLKLFKYISLWEEVVVLKGLC